MPVGSVDFSNAQTDTDGPPGQRADEDLKPHKKGENMTSEHARYLISLHGKVASQPAKAWKGTFSLPDSLARFYDEVGPVDVDIEAYGNAFHLPRLAKLWAMQAGYRWEGGTKKPIPDWDDDWLVVADQGGDPFILSRSTGAILFDEHGSGRWQPRPLFPDLNAMAACLGLLGEVVVSAGDDLTDEKSRIQPKHRARAVSGLRDILGSEAEAESVLKALSWG